MHITTILGSAKKKGNTATVLSWVEEELISMEHDVERIYLNNKSIGGCMGCGKCREKPDELGCVQADDAIEILEKMVSADAVLLASPVYFWSFSAQTKLLIDRSYSLVTNYHKPGHTSLLRGKPVGLLVTGADAYEDNAEGLFTSFERIADFWLARSATLYVGPCSTPDALSETERKLGIALARALMA